MQKITSLISSFDIYGSLFNFTINRRLIFKTSIGGIISLITFLFVIYTSYLFGKDFFYRINPKVFMQEVTPIESERIKIKNKNFTLAWRIEDKLKTPIEFPKGLIFPQIFYRSYDNIIKYIPIKKCNEIFNDDNFNLLANENINLNTNQWNCIDFDYSEFYLGGSSMNFGFDRFEILFNTCNNDITEKTDLNIEIQNRNVSQYDKISIENKINSITHNYSSASYKDADDLNITIQNQISEQINTKDSNQRCGEIFQLQDFLSESKFISILYPKAYYTFTELKNPFKIKYNKYVANINLNLIKFDEFSLNSEILSDDDSWIFTNAINYMGLSIRDIKTSYYFQDFSAFNGSKYFKENITFYSFKIFLKKDYFQYFRSFMKFQDFAAIVGGFVKILTLIISFLYDKYNIFSRDKYLIDHLFDNGKKLEKLNGEKNIYNIYNYKSSQSMNNILDINSKSYSKINNTNIKDEKQKLPRKSYNPNLNKIFDHLSGRFLNSPGTKYRSYSISGKRLRKLSDNEDQKKINGPNQIETIILNKDDNQNDSPIYNNNMNNLYIENKNNVFSLNLSPNQNFKRVGSLNTNDNALQSNFKNNKNESINLNNHSRRDNKKNPKNFNEMNYDFHSDYSINYKNLSIDNNVQNFKQELIKNDNNSYSERNKNNSKLFLDSKKEFRQNNIETSQILINRNELENQKNEQNLKKKKSNKNSRFIKDFPINFKGNNKSPPESLESNPRISLDRKNSNFSQVNNNYNPKKNSSNLYMNSSLGNKNKYLTKKFNNYINPNFETENEIQSRNDNPNNYFEGENLDFFRLNTKDQNNTYANLKNFSKSFKLEYSSNRLKSRYSRKTNILKMNFFYYCCIKYFKKNLSREEERKMFIFEYAREYISKKLDLFKYLKNLSYLNLILELISNSNQKTALKYLSQPCIQTENFDIVKRVGISPIERHNNMIEYFNNFCDDENFSLFDSKLLTMLNKKFSNIY